MNNKEIVKVTSYLMQNLKNVKEREKPVILRCEFCGKHIVGTKWNKQYHHINISQNPKKRLFCSHQCKLKWIFNNF
ncbi:MAG: hypothetical protein ACFFCV_11840 [Promethearchaeota archaeon]